MADYFYCFNCRHAKSDPFLLPCYTCNGISEFQFTASAKKKKLKRTVKKAEFSVEETIVLCFLSCLGLLFIVEKFLQVMKPFWDIIDKF